MKSAYLASGENHLRIAPNVPPKVAPIDCIKYKTNKVTIPDTAAAVWLSVNDDVNIVTARYDAPSSTKPMYAPIS